VLEFDQAYLFYFKSRTNIVVLKIKESVINQPVNFRKINTLANKIYLSFTSNRRL
jgi:hypothetical protein